MEPTFFVKYKYIWVPVSRQIQKQIVLGLPKKDEYENKYDYSDWYLQTQILSKKNINIIRCIQFIKVCKLLQVGVIIYNLWWLIKKKKSKNLFDFIKYYFTNTNLLGLTKQGKFK